MVQIYNGILLSYQKEWNNAICSNMDGPRDYHTKWNKTEKDIYIYIYLTNMWNLKKKWCKWTYVKNRNRLTDIENTFMVTKGERQREEID